MLLLMVLQNIFLGQPKAKTFFICRKRAIELSIDSFLSAEFCELRRNYNGLFINRVITRWGGGSLVQLKR